MIDKKLSRAEFNVDFWAQMFVVKWEVELSTAAFAATFQMLLNVYKEYVSVSRLTGNDML